MDKPQFKIAFTTEEISDFEPNMIAEILDQGWDMIHIRHPRASFRDMRNLIESIPMRYHSRLRLHGHFELLNSFNLGGIHLNRRCPVPPDNYRGPYSRSCHSFGELKECDDCDYVTLSPIFDSISKNGYRSGFEKKQLFKFDKTASSGVTIKVIALGGITPERLPPLSDMDFDGFAALGALTGASDLEEFRKNLRSFTQTLNNI